MPDEKPDLTDKANQPPAVTPLPADFVPRTKDDWNKLSKENPARWAELTQARMDEVTRKEREANEKLDRERQEKLNLQAELDKFKNPIISPTEDQPKQYGNGVYPQNEIEWNDLFIDRPAFANQLMNQFQYEQNSKREESFRIRKSAVEQLVSDHPEMYESEIDPVTQKPKLDDKGKVIVKKNRDGGYAFDPNSEKGKLWTEIWNEDPQGWGNVKNAPGLMQAEMERRLRQRGQTVVNQAQNNLNDDQSGLAPQGVPPPKNSTLKWASEEERALAQKRISAGVYKSEEDYCNWRDKGQGATFDHPNSRPDFSKK